MSIRYVFESHSPRYTHGFVQLKYQNKQNKNIQLKDVSSSISPTQIQRKIIKDELKEKILLICKNQKHYIQKMLNTLRKTEENVSIICDYIIAKQNEIKYKGINQGRQA